MKIHLINGFLGSGKTTAIQQACGALLQENKRVGVITNDQGIRLVDSDFFNSLNIPNRQVVNGCFCCNYNDFDAKIESFNKTIQPDIIFAESVGSCTDIVATVMKPFLRFRSDVQVTLSVFADVRLLRMIIQQNQASFDETVKYIYQKQLEEARIILINKIDLITTEELEDVQKFMKQQYPKKILLYVNALEIESLRQWLTVLDTFTTKELLPSLEIDYDKYGAGEAMLAWLDEEVEICSSSRNATDNANELIKIIYKKIEESKLPVGHLKFFLNDKVKISYTTAGQPDITGNITQTSTAKLLINARVQTSPEKLKEIVNEAISETELKHECKVVINSLSSFKPGFPTPTHRFAN